MFNTLLMPPAFYLAATRGLNSIALPWISIFPLVAFLLVVKTLRQIHLPFLSYLAAFKGALVSVVLMILALYGADQLSDYFPWMGTPNVWVLAGQFLIGGAVYLATLALFRADAARGT